MLYGYRCLDEKCEYEWEDRGCGYPDRCPECSADEFEELYDLECRECGFQFVGSENEECPECESWETYEI